MQAGSLAATSERYPARRIKAVAVSVALGLVLIATPMVFAGKGGSTMTPWIALAAVDGSSTLAAAAPRLGSSVKFSAGYPTGTKNAWVSLRCYQDGVLVYGEGGAPSGSFTLGGGSSVWLADGGSASCQAELGDLYWRGGRQYYTYLADTWFDAEA
jgi:hypothetical protein